MISSPTFDQKPLLTSQPVSVRRKIWTPPISSLKREIPGLQPIPRPRKAPTTARKSFTPPSRAPMIPRPASMSQSSHMMKRIGRPLRIPPAIPQVRAQSRANFRSRAQGGSFFNRNVSLCGSRGPRQNSHSSLTPTMQTITLGPEHMPPLEKG